MSLILDLYSFFSRMSYIFTYWEDVDAVEFFLDFHGFLSIKKQKEEPRLL